MPESTAVDNAGPTIGRRKVRTACVPCKDRKRKCDGKLPCATCLRYEYECRYGKSTSKSASPPTTKPEESIDNTIVSSAVAKSGDAGQTSLFSVKEATSGVAFSQAVGSTHAVTQTSKEIGWNLGTWPVLQDVQQSLSQPMALPAVSTQQETVEEIQKYISSIGTLYPIITLQTALYLARGRYEHMTHQLEPLLDAVLSVMVALSYIFAGRKDYDTAQKLACNARLCFNLCSEGEPTNLRIVAWSLYAILLRAIGSAHACWMASCTAVHLIDAMPTPQKQNTNDILLSEEDGQCLYWTTRLMHMWISFELGRPPIISTPTVADDRSLAKIVRNKEPNVLGLFVATRVISVSDPSTDQSRLEQSFASLEAFNCGNNDALALSRCILAMTTFRRRLIQHPPMSPDLKTRMIAIGRDSLLSVERLLDGSAPWWHLVNVPLQFLCLLLVVGALAEAPRAMRTLRAVATAHPTDRVKETVAYAERILQAIYAQRMADCKLLEESLGLDEAVNNGFMGDGFSNPQSSLPVNATWNLPVTLDDLNWGMFPSTGTSIFDLGQQW